MANGQGATRISKAQVAAAPHGLLCREEACAKSRHPRGQIVAAPPEAEVADDHVLGVSHHPSVRIVAAPKFFAREPPGERTVSPSEERSDRRCASPSPVRPGNGAQVSPSERSDRRCAERGRLETRSDSARLTIRAFGSSLRQIPPLWQTPSTYCLTIRAFGSSLRQRGPERPAARAFADPFPSGSFSRSLEGLNPALRAPETERKAA